MSNEWCSRVGEKITLDKQFGEEFHETRFELDFERQENRYRIEREVERMEDGILVSVV